MTWHDDIGLTRPSSKWISLTNPGLLDPTRFNPFSTTLTYKNDPARILECIVWFLCLDSKTRTCLICIIQRCMLTTHIFTNIFSTIFFWLIKIHMNFNKPYRSHKFSRSHMNFNQSKSVLKNVFLLFKCTIFSSPEYFMLKKTQPLKIWNLL